MSGDGGPLSASGRSDAEIQARNDRFAARDPHAEGRRLHEEACAESGCTPGIEGPTLEETIHRARFLHSERPACGTQHIDQATDEWPNPPHRSHLCSAEGCGTIWRPADVPTVGVEAIETSSTSDNWVSAVFSTGRVDIKYPQGQRPLCSYVGCHNWTNLDSDGRCDFHPLRLLPPCNKAPVGWRCTRGAGHDGPCAAVQVHNPKYYGGLVERQAVIDALADYPQAQMAVRRIPHAQG